MHRSIRCDHYEQSRSHDETCRQRDDSSGVHLLFLSLDAFTFTFTLLRVNGPGECALMFVNVWRSPTGRPFRAARVRHRLWILGSALRHKDAVTPYSCTQDPLAICMRTGVAAACTSGSIANAFPIFLAPVTGGQCVSPVLPESLRRAPIVAIRQAFRICDWRRYYAVHAGLPASKVSPQA